MPFAKKVNVKRAVNGDAFQDLIFDIITNGLTETFETEVLFDAASGRTYRVDFKFGQELLETKGGFRVRFASRQRNAAFRQAVEAGANLFFLRVLCKDQ